MRFVLLGAIIAGTFWPTRAALGSRGEAFWLLFPLWVLAGAHLLHLFPGPRMAATSRFVRLAMPATLVLFPTGLYLGMTAMLGGRPSARELAVAIYFFAVSLEILLCYAFQAARSVSTCITNRRKGRGGAVLAAASKVALYAALIPFLLATFSVHRVKVLPGELDSRLGLPWESVSFPAREERPPTIRGWFFPHPNAAGTILACHGVGANRADLIDIISLLHTAGFQILAFDFRGHGESDGHTVTYGWLERNDVLGAWDYLISRKDVDPGRIFGLGVSMGAATLLLALPDLPLLRAAVADSAFSDLETMALHQYRWFPAPIDRCFAAATGVFGWLETGIRVEDVSPLLAIQHVSIPIQFFHGSEDSIVPPDCSQRLFDAYRGPKRLRIQPGAVHGGTAAVDATRYRREVRAFFLDAAK
jgi:alpha-beta hydrolase superfamily lysophospholipase